MWEYTERHQGYKHYEERPPKDIEGGICKQRREASEESEPAATLNLDFQPPELWANKLFKPPRVWCFLTVALEN